MASLLITLRFFRYVRDEFRECILYMRIYVSIVTKIVTIIQMFQIEAISVPAFIRSGST